MTFSDFKQHTSDYQRHNYRVHRTAIAVAAFNNTLVGGGMMAGTIGEDNIDGFYLELGTVYGGHVPSNWLLDNSAPSSAFESDDCGRRVYEKNSFAIPKNQTCPDALPYRIMEGDLQKDECSSYSYCQIHPKFLRLECGEMPRCVLGVN